MKAVVFKGKERPIEITEIAKPKPVKDQVLIRLKNASLNHRDLWIFRDQELVGSGVVPGSDGSGVVESVGEDADEISPGSEVVINPGLEWGKNPAVQGDTFKILGFPDNGTFAEFVAVSKKYVFEKPGHLSFEEAAAMPLAALTAYRALFSKARLRANEKVLITGIGGGVALWLLQFAVAYKARVYVTSSSPEKLQRAIRLGALGGFNYTDPEWSTQAAKEAGGGFDIIIDSAGGKLFGKYVELALPGGRIINYGRTAGNIDEISTRLLYWKQLTILGTAMGTRDEFLSMLDFVENRQMKPVIDTVYPLGRFHDAVERMRSSSQFGKIVLKISD